MNGANKPGPSLPEVLELRDPRDIRPDTAAGHGRPFPVCGILAFCLPAIGFVVAIILVNVMEPHVYGGWSKRLLPAFAGSWALCPASLLGLGVSVVALVRRERLRVLGILGFLLNAVVAMPTAYFTWITLQTLGSR